MVPILRLCLHCLLLILLFFYSLAVCCSSFHNASYVVNLVPCLFWICVDVDVVYKICPGALFGFSDYCFRFVSLDSIFFFIFSSVSFFNFL